MASNAADFLYTDLDLTRPDAFRLLELHPEDGSAEVRCTLINTTRSNVGTSYRAISYAWGSAQRSQPILLNGGHFRVTENLDRVLRSFKAANQTGRFWVDAICINQDRLEERNQQVQQMLEIYAGASEVCVWLGPSHPSRPLESSFLEALSARATELEILSEDMLSMFKVPLDNCLPLIDEFMGDQFVSQWSAIADLMQQRWWTRTWVIQELSSGKNVTLYHGHTSLSLPQTLLIIQLLRTCHVSLLGVSALLEFYREQSDILSGARELLAMRYIVNHGLGAVFHNLLRLSRKTFCQDPRDKVFAIHGLAPKEVRMLFKPDYSLSTSWVFGMAISIHIFDKQNLDILLNIDNGLENSGFPSWIVDWTKPHACQYFANTSLGFKAGYADGPLLAVPYNMTILNVEGIYIDTIRNHRLQGSEEALDKDSQGQFTWDLDAVVAGIQSLGGIINSHNSTANDVIERSRQQIEGALYDTLVAGHQREWTQSNTYQRQIVMYPDEQDPTPKRPLRPINSERMLSAATMWTRNRTLILSESGSLGLAPAASRPGDYIFVILGLCMPAILRPNEDGTWTLVGTAYIRGLVDGEAVECLSYGMYQKTMLKLA
ncbi:heterokaryon incompatibility protein-domain-containing protein [Bisporella sp. PMI_857]|nr:heterokaryon incompatibility protein-domain-containing protein [Bisporella sp. PMI_857]